jgi:hypothetical protein
MLPAYNTKIALYLMMQSSLLGLVKAGGIFRLICFDDLRIDVEDMDVYGEHWGLGFEEFSDSVRVFNHDDFPEFLELYPESANQMMLEAIWKRSGKIDIPTLAEIVKTFRPVQHGMMKKD